MSYLRGSKIDRDFKLHAETSESATSESELSASYHQSVEGVKEIKRHESRVALMENNAE